MIDVLEVSVTIMVEDLDRAEDFYRGLLGGRVLLRAGPHFRMMEVGGVKIGLHPRTAPREPGPPPLAVTLGLRVPDIRASVTTLEENGIPVPRGVESDDGALLRADFTDPDGTPLHLVETPDPG